MQSCSIECQLASFLELPLQSKSRRCQLSGSWRNEVASTVPRSPELHKVSALMNLKLQASCLPKSIEKRLAILASILPKRKGRISGVDKASTSELETICRACSCANQNLSCACCCSNRRFQAASWTLLKIA